MFPPQQRSLQLPPRPGKLTELVMVVVLTQGAGKKVQKCKDIQNISVRIIHVEQVKPGPCTELDLRGWGGQKPADGFVLSELWFSWAAHGEKGI